MFLFPYRAKRPRVMCECETEGIYHFRRKYKYHVWRMSAVSGSRVFSQHDRDRDLNAHGAFLVFYDSNPETTGIFFCCGRHRDPAPFILSFIEDAFSRLVLDADQTKTL